MAIEISPAIRHVMSCFSESFVNREGELILVPKTNLFINLNNKNNLEIKASLLEWASRDACISEPLERGNTAYQDTVRKSLNNVFETNWDRREMRLIYRNLGNAVDHQLTLDFIENNLNLTVLDYKDQL